jgi:peptidoglycan hydrolase-like protein with peptidoglycan-binding domain
MTNKNFFSIAILTAFALAVIVVPTVTHADTLTRYLSVGSSGSDVSSVQAFLAADPSLYPRGLVTGYFGSLTKGAVINFQNRNGIDPVGRIGPATLPVLNAQMASGMINKQAPTISNLGINTTASTVTLSWNTDEPTAALVYYSTNQITAMEANGFSPVTISGSTSIFHNDLRTTHAGTISGLTPNTNYSYVVYVRDGQGNESVSSAYTFHTPSY